MREGAHRSHSGGGVGAREIIPKPPLCSEEARLNDGLRKGDGSAGGGEGGAGVDEEDEEEEEEEERGATVAA